jgi:hypothetical protein
MKPTNVLASCLLAVVTFAAVWTIAEVRWAVADPPLLDAGPGAGPAAESLGVPATQPSILTPAVTDPVADSSGFARDVQGAFKAGRWALLVVLFLFGVSRVLLAVAAKWEVAWLKRATPALVAGSAALAAVGASLSAGGAVDYHAAAGGLAMVVALYLSPSAAPKA